MQAWQLCYILFPALVLLHLYISPYTKVEESFNLQAIHDILEYGVPISDAAAKFNALFDHMTFPGAVPRTFIGSLLVSGLTEPLVWLSKAQGRAAQFEARAVLGLITSSSLSWFARSVNRSYGPQAALWYVVLQSSQFHIWYYASRTLPNTFACCLSNVGLALLMNDPTSRLGNTKRKRLGLYLITIATVNFRSELALLLAAQCIWMIAGTKNVNQIVNILKHVCIHAVLPGALLGVLLTVSIDSYFWQTKFLLWPELTAFLSNILPKAGSQGASAWGTEPFYWYLTSALPRLLMNSAAILASFMVIPVTWSDGRVFDHLVPSILYVLSYSILPHKETRFMFPVVPALTLVAALTCTRMTLNKHKSAGRKLFVQLVAVWVPLTALLSHGVLLPLSANNYPGGEALGALHSYVFENWESAGMDHVRRGTKPEIRVHLTNLALQSGVTKFLEQPQFLRSGFEPGLLQPAVSAHHYGSDKRDPIVLPGDASHPALTVRPSIPKPSTTTLPQGKTSPQLLWFYDKTSNESTLLEPAFWMSFDFVIVENPARASGAWEVLKEVQAVGRPRVIHIMGGVEPRTPFLFRALYPQLIAKFLTGMHDAAFVTLGRFTRGYWVELPLETKLYILKPSKSGTAPTVEVPALPSRQATDHKPLQLDDLGPLVVNKDGTLSRLDNWKQMTEQERKRTVSYLKKRNMLRMEEAEAAAI